MIDTAKLKWIFHRLAMGRGGDILDLAEKEWELGSGEVSISRPAIYPDGELDKVRQLAPMRSWKLEQAFITGAEIDHWPTRAFELSDVTISEAYLYRGKTRAQYGACEQGLLSRDQAECQDIEAANLVTCKVGSEHFGHFLWDNIPMELLPGPEANPITLCALPRWHEEDYRKLFSLPKPRLVRSGRVKKLILYSDVGQNTFREKRYRELRARLRKSLQDNSSKSANPGVFILRGSGGDQRHLINATEIKDCLCSYGFTVVDPDKLSGEEIATRSMDAQIVIGVEGSHIAHSLYTVADGGAFLMLQPPDRFSMVYKEFTDRLGLSYAFLVGDPVEGGFRIDAGKLRRLLERLYKC